MNGNILSYYLSNLFSFLMSILAYNTDIPTNSYVLVYNKISNETLKETKGDI